MWVFTKEYVDKYNVPVDEIHSLEDLEPWLKVIHENEPDVVPMYLTSSYSAPIYMDLIQDPVGIEYGDETLTVPHTSSAYGCPSPFVTKRLMDLSSDAVAASLLI